MTTQLARLSPEPVAGAADPRECLARRRRRRGWGLISTLTAIVGLLAAAVPASAVRPPAAAAPALAWEPCADPAQRGFQCATLRVPLDYDDPGGRTIRLAVIRRRATDPRHRIGTLFFNFGWAGRRGHAAAARARGSRRRWQARFDIASWDPRGVGESTAVHCFASPEAEIAFLDDMVVSASFPVGSAEMDTWTRALPGPRPPLRATQRWPVAPRLYRRHGPRPGPVAPRRRRPAPELRRALLRHLPGRHLRQPLPRPRPGPGARRQPQPEGVREPGDRGQPAAAS